MSTPLANYHLTEIQFKLHKLIKGMENRGLKYHIHKWHSQNDSRKLAIELSIRKFHEKYVFDLPEVRVDYGINHHKHTPEDWTLLSRPGPKPKKGDYNDHILELHELQDLNNSLKKLEGEYLSLKRKLKRLDRINGSLKAQGIL